MCLICALYILCVLAIWMYIRKIDPPMYLWFVFHNIFKLHLNLFFLIPLLMELIFQPFQENAMKRFLSNLSFTNFYRLWMSLLSLLEQTFFIKISSDHTFLNLMSVLNQHSGNSLYSVLFNLHEIPSWIRCIFLLLSHWLYSFCLLSQFFIFSI